MDKGNVLAHDVPVPGDVHDGAFPTQLRNGRVFKLGTVEDFYGDCLSGMGALQALGPPHYAKVALSDHDIELIPALADGPTCVLAHRVASVRRSKPCIASCLDHVSSMLTNFSWNYIC